MLAGKIICSKESIKNWLNYLSNTALGWQTGNAKQHGATEIIEFIEDTFTTALNTASTCDKTTLAYGMELLLQANCKGGRVSLTWMLFCINIADLQHIRIGRWLKK